VLKNNKFVGSKRKKKVAEDNKRDTNRSRVRMCRRYGIHTRDIKFSTKLKKGESVDM